MPKSNFKNQEARRHGNVSHVLGLARRLTSLKKGFIVNGLCSQSKRAKENSPPHSDGATLPSAPISAVYLVSGFFALSPGQAAQTGRVAKLSKLRVQLEWGDQWRAG